MLPLEEKNQTIGAELLAYFPYLKNCGRTFDPRHIVRVAHFDYRRQSTGNNRICLALVFALHISHAGSLSVSYNVTFDYKKEKYFRTLIKPSTFFRPNIPLDMRRCALRVGFTNWAPFILSMNHVDTSGIEGETIFVIKDQYNAKLNLTRFVFRDANMLHGLIALGDTIIMRNRSRMLMVGVRLIPRSTELGIASLQAHEFDMIIGGTFPYPRSLDVFDTSAWYLHSNFNWFVPRGSTIKGDMILWKFFETNYRSIIVFFLVVYLSTALMHLIQVKFRFGRFSVFGYLKISEIATRLFLATSNPSLPTATRMRLMLGSWCIGCVFLNIIIQTNFASLLTSPGAEPDIESQEELLKNDLPKIYSKT